MKTRTDAHCPTNFIVADYSFKMAFSVGFDHEGNPIDEDGLNALVSLAYEGNTMADTHNVNVKRLTSMHQNASYVSLRCDVCGATFLHGCLLSHKSGEMIVVGNECAETISGAMQDAKRIKGLILQATKRNKAAKIANAKKAMIAKVLEANPGLAEALNVDHHIISDINWRLRQWGNISEKQIELVMRIAGQVNERKNARETQEANMINVPTSVTVGRVKITGKIVATKVVDQTFGYNTTSVIKGLIMVDTPEGQWKTWGTIPDSLLTVDGSWVNHETVRGKTVTFMARVSIADNDPKMSFFSRPSKAEVVAN